MIERIERVQSISYNATRILPIRPYSKEEQKLIIAEINRCAEQYAKVSFNEKDFDNPGDFEKLLSKAIEKLNSVSSVLPSSVLSFDSQNTMEFIKNSMLQQQNYLNCCIAVKDIDLSKGNKTDLIDYLIG